MVIGYYNMCLTYAQRDLFLLFGLGCNDFNCDQCSMYGGGGGVTITALLVVWITRGQTFFEPLTMTVCNNI
jgi:hypothetical protein